MRGESRKSQGKVLVCVLSNLVAAVITEMGGTVATVPRTVTVLSHAVGWGFVHLQPPWLRYEMVFSALHTRRRCPWRPTQPCSPSTATDEAE